MKYYYIVDLDERGYYNAHVEDEFDNIVYEISNEYYNEELNQTWYGPIWLIEDGYMKDTYDIYL